ncbi:1046_t:CDS:2 [Dentiscutata erythropus]|uniref:1046_t:CDS:1 n=1 Tax=Dentiscutata erythropus TaxID=1348616 RepID=A0A9N9AYD9_9GLOM|nr:1046_t:CDS:2 [Dentiscutata erythropus]
MDFACQVCYIPQLSSMAPIVFCTLFTFIIISREFNEYEYRKWWSTHSRTALATTLLSGLDVEVLNVASSHIASIGSLNAPYSPEADRRILYATVFILITEDMPQFIFLIIYQRVIVIPAIVPILALSSCTILIFLKAISIIYYAFFYERKLRHEDDEPTNETDAPTRKTEKKPDNRPSGQTHIVTFSSSDPIIDIGESHEKPSKFKEVL